MFLWFIFTYHSNLIRHNVSLFLLQILTCLPLHKSISRSWKKDSGKMNFIVIILTFLTTLGKLWKCLLTFLLDSLHWQSKQAHLSEVWESLEHCLQSGIDPYFYRYQSLEYCLEQLFEASPRIEESLARK